MQNETFFQDPRLPFAECRFSRNSPAVFKPHMHAAVSIGAVEEGEVRYTVGDSSSVLKPGSLALIDAEELHSCNARQSARRSYSMLYLDAGWCLTVQQSLWKVAELVPFATIRLDDERLYDLYCSTMRRLPAPDNHLQEKEQLLVELVGAVFESGCNPQAPLEHCSGDIEQLRRILRKDLERDLTLEALAKTLGGNPYSLLRKFKAETGITPHAYRMNCRIERARQLLREGRDIAETALECGFFDQSHLHRHFKAMTTVTPRQYRLNFLQNG